MLHMQVHYVHRCSASCCNSHLSHNHTSLTTTLERVPVLHMCFSCCEWVHLVHCWPVKIPVPLSWSRLLLGRRPLLHVAAAAHIDTLQCSSLVISAGYGWLLHDAVAAHT